MNEATAELEALAGACAQADAVAIPVPPPVDENGQPLPPPPDYATEAAGAVDFFAAMATGYCPKAEPIWSPACKGRVAAALVPVFEKYNFTMGGMPPEFALLLVAGPPLYQTSRLIAAQIAADRAEAAAKNPAPAEDKTGAEPVPPPLRHAQVDLYPAI